MVVTALFLFCRTSLSLHQKAAFLMPPKVQSENTSGIAEVLASFVLR
jgi:hypothetical protein